jgi:hypothetical protein
MGVTSRTAKEVEILLSLDGETLCVGYLLLTDIAGNDIGINLFSAVGHLGLPGTISTPDFPRL